MNKTITTPTKTKKRNYFRKCGSCGNRQEQSLMIRTNSSPNGWLCKKCYKSNDYYENYPIYEDYITAHDNDIW